MSDSNIAKRFFKEPLIQFLLMGGCIYGAFAVIGLLLIIKLLPETRGKSLEQLERELVGA